MLGSLLPDALYRQLYGSSFSENTPHTPKVASCEPRPCLNVTQLAIVALKSETAEVVDG